METKPRGTLIDVRAIRGADIAVASTGTAYSDSFVLPRGVSFGFEFQFDSAAAVDVKIELEQSNVRPATEGAADANYVVPTGASAISSGVTVETTVLIPFAPMVTRYARFKFTGQGSNAASTKVTKARVCTMEN